MLSSRLRALCAWFCVALIAFVGVVPAQGLVLCLEPDGAMALKVGSTQCGGCADGVGGQSGVRSVTHEQGCPCVDIPIFSTGEHSQLQATSIELRIDVPLTAAPAPLAILPVLPAEPLVTIGSPPRPAERLAHIRTVVLLV